jgi:hypothetical protein
MCRAEPQPGGAATTLERVTEKSIATADRGDRPVTFVNFTAKNAMPARYVLKRADWAGAAALPFTPSQYPQPDSLTRFTRGLGMARTGDLAGADSTHASLPPSGGLNQRLVSSLEALSWASSCLIAVVGLAVLLGWHFDIELLRAGLPGRTPVNPATALALLLAACALWMYHQARARPDLHRFAGWR